MNRSSITLAAAGGLALLLGSAATADEREPTRAEQRAERLLAGKTAGEPQQCIRRDRLRNATVPNDETILYRQNSRLVYRTSIEGGCPGLTDDRSMGLHSISRSQVCEGDQIEVVDNQSGMQFGRCALGPFVPYRAN